MKHLIRYTQYHKEIMEYAISMAIAWHEVNIEPVYQALVKAFNRHNPESKHLDEVSRRIRQNLEAIRNLDIDGEVFGNNQVIKGIHLSSRGETEITEEEANALESLSEKVCRLLVGQVRYCFDWGSYDNFYSKIKQNDFDKIITDLHTLCWNQSPYEEYGKNYSEESDILWDISQTFQYQRYLNMSPREKKMVQNTVLPYPPLHTANEPLIEIMTIP